MKTTCGYHNIIEEDKIKTTLIVEIEATSACPCSKEISKNSAHNQRCTIRLEVGEKDFIWFEDLIYLLESSASAPVFTLLKRTDEAYLTDLAYDNPKFVEDIVREVYTKMINEYKDKISRIKIEVESDESIHQHKAFAIIDKVIE